MTYTENLDTLPLFTLAIRIEYVLHNELQSETVIWLAFLYLWKITFSNNKNPLD